MTERRRSRAVLAARRRVCVVVLGDVGRSPRMQNHAISLSKNGFIVDIIGYSGSHPAEEVLENKNINVCYMEDVPQFSEYVPKLLAYIFKVIWQSVALLIALFLLPKPDRILAQNPPSIPTLAVLWFYALIRSSYLVIDWHNYGYTILALALGREHLMVKFAKWFEECFGRKAYRHLCVSKAMRDDLFITCSICSVVLYDRPPLKFHSISLEEKHALFTKLAQEYSCFNDEYNSDHRTAFTKVNADGIVSYRNDRPALLISSTSWTEDEDFSLLLNALEAYDEAMKTTNRPLPKLVCAITGKGPLREHYANLIAIKKFTSVKICLPWLSAEDYPKLLASADLGVCLHTSSSGLDLPMKVVDMFGCGLPVLAYRFECLDELVRHSENGLVFNSSEELHSEIQDVLMGFPVATPQLNSFRENLKEFQRERWEENWKNIALPIFKE